jgi:hypothetical protein
MGAGTGSRHLRGQLQTTPAADSKRLELTPQMTATSCRSPRR